MQQLQDGTTMGIFGSIKDAIFGRDEDEAAQRPAPAPSSAPKPVAPRSPAPASTAPKTPDAPRKPLIDIVNHLDSMPGADRLNWRTSIVDLMKLLGIDSDYESRKALAEELGRADYSGTVEDNVWLHRRVMQGLSQSGGRVPDEFLD